MPRFDLVYLARMPKTIEETPNPMLASARGPPQRNCVRADAAGEFCRFHDHAQHRLLSPEPIIRRRLAKLGAVEVRFPSDQAERDEIVQVAAEQKTNGRPTMACKIYSPGWSPRS